MLIIFVLFSLKGSKVGENVGEHEPYPSSQELFQETPWLHHSQTVSPKVHNLTVTTRALPALLGEVPLISGACSLD